MCGRVFVRSTPVQLLKNFAWARAADLNLDGFWPRFNGAPGLDYPIIVREPDEPGGLFVIARWGFIPRQNKEAHATFRPINAAAETIATAGKFKAAYRLRRALMPIDGFFEWRSTKPAKRRPYAIAMNDGQPFCVAAIWDRWRNPKTGATMRTSAVVTCPANELVGQIYHRMPAIIAPNDYIRWLSDVEPDPRDLLRPYPADLMSMWPISTRVNRPANNGPDILDPEPEPGG